MAKNEQRNLKNDKKKRFPWNEKDLFCTDSILLRGNHSVVLYGCNRILFYGRDRICFLMKGRAVSVVGKNICCTVFSPLGVTVEGSIAGIYYCSGNCEGSCHLIQQKEEEI